MRVGVDGRSLVQPGGRGIARYTRTLLSELAQSFPDDRWHVLVPSGARDPDVPGTDPVAMRLPGRIPYALGGAIGRPRADRVVGGVDVFWAPAPGPIALSSGVPLVLSLHDLSWELRPSDFTSYERLWHRIARPRGMAERADRVVAVSDVTREQAIARWHLDPARVITIREGIRTPDGAARALTDIPRRYYLSVGALEPRKAPDLLVRAFRQARTDGLEAGLVFVGEGRLRDGLSGDGVHVLGHVSDGDLAELYRGAVALVMPSRLEGFGLPPVEAALVGTPAIVADLPVYTETLGEGALRVPVDDVPALASALLALERNQPLRARLSSSARDHVRDLTPARSAAALHAVLLEVAGR